MKLYISTCFSCTLKVLVRCIFIYLKAFANSPQKKSLLISSATHFYLGVCHFPHWMSFWCWFLIFLWGQRTNFFLLFQVPHYAYVGMLDGVLQVPENVFIFFILYLLFLRLDNFNWPIFHPLILLHAQICSGEFFIAVIVCACMRERESVCVYFLSHYWYPLFGETSSSYFTLVP